MSKDYKHVKDFLNEDFERYMHERNVSIVMSSNVCSHEIAIPQTDDIHIDFSATNGRNGNPERNSDTTRHSICACADGNTFDDLLQAWEKIELERLRLSAASFVNLLQTIEVQGCIDGDVPKDAEKRLLDCFNVEKQEESRSTRSRDPEKSCFDGLTK